jgi:hypothetical protein
MFSRADHGEAQRALLKDDRLLRDKEVSEMLGAAIATLHAWRRVGNPAFIRPDVPYVSAVHLHEPIRQAATPPRRPHAPKRAEIGLRP